MILVLACAWGALYRDGFPATHSTHLARFIGGFAAFWGYGAHGEPLINAAIVGLAVWGGWYLDQKHGEGQRARGFEDGLYLFASGITSLALPALGALVAGNLLAPLLLMALGALKPAIWFAAWTIRPDRWWSWVEPTRVGALVFMALAGLALSF